MKHIHNLTCGYTVGSLTYSEGVNDDVNKFVWGDQDWDPTKPVEETLRDYARFFLGPDGVDDVVEGLFALERNWERPLAGNEDVEETLALWQNLEARASRELLANWRFQQGLLRASLDAFIRRRLLRESDLEKQAWAVLRSGMDVAALDQAQRILDEARSAPVALDLRRRCDELADGLWEGIGEQLTTTRHCGQRTGRGAFLDSIDLPLNDAAWMRESFGRVRGLGDVAAQRRAIAEMISRTDPGPGGFYDCFGDPESWQRVVPGEGWARDPGFFATPLMAFWPGPTLRAWQTSLTAYYDLPIRIRYTGLDPTAAYRVCVTYVSGPWPYHVRLWANETWVMHDELAIVKGQCLTREFALPGEVTTQGKIDLTWRTGNGELGARIAEIWLRKGNGGDSVEA